MKELDCMRRRALIIQAADYCILYGWTIREIAENMMVGKSSVQRWLMNELPYIDDEKYQQVKKILECRKL